MAISLIRAQTENTKPPRALWVPFELGRPFGPPSDTAFQKRVILAALRLLERERGPVIIEDFPEDDPRERPDPGWRPPFAKPDLDWRLGNSARRCAGGRERAGRSHISTRCERAGANDRRAQRALCGRGRSLHGQLAAGTNPGKPERRNVRAADPAFRGRRSEGGLYRGRALRTPPNRRASSWATGCGTTPRLAQRSSPCAACI